MAKKLSALDALDLHETLTSKSIFVRKTKMMLEWGNNPQMHELLGIYIRKPSMQFNEIMTFIRNYQ